MLSDPSCRLYVLEACMTVKLVILRLDDISPFLLSLSALADRSVMVLGVRRTGKVPSGWSLQQLCDVLVDTAGAFDKMIFMIAGPYYEGLTDEEVFIRAMKELAEEAIALNVPPPPRVEAAIQRLSDDWETGEF